MKNCMCMDTGGYIAKFDIVMKIVLTMWLCNMIREKKRYMQFFTGRRAHACQSRRYSRIRGIFIQLHPQCLDSDWPGFVRIANQFAYLIKKTAHELNLLAGLMRNAWS